MIFASRALLPEGWAENVRITVAEGRIAAVTTGAKAQTGDVLVSALLSGLAVRSRLDKLDLVAVLKTPE